MLAGMDSVEAAQWDASMRLDPDESDRADIRHALLMDLMVKLTPRSKNQRGKLPDAVDFLAALPWREEAEERAPTRPQTPAELQAKINAVMRMFGGKVRGG